jgi:hypothetical protein
LAPGQKIVEISAGPPTTEEQCGGDSEPRGHIAMYYGEEEHP